MDGVVLHTMAGSLDGLHAVVTGGGAPRVLMDGSQLFSVQAAEAALLLLATTLL